MEEKQVLKLMKLEMKKFQLWHYWKAFAICNLGFVFFVSMIFFIEENEGNIPFEDYEMVTSIISALVRATFTIFAAVIIVKLVIDEYKYKSMYIMFSYPIKRKKIMVAKLTIVFTFTFFTVVFSTLFLEGLLYVAEVYFNILPGEIMIADITRTIVTAFMNALATAGISLIPLLFGMHRKSGAATIVSAIIIATLLSSTNGDFTLFSIIAIPISLGLLGLFIGYYSIRNVEKVDLR